ncbi:MAG: threonylcarbamoyl-AMP synthase [Betaproteobacteria bacterium]|nr:threonylcarbamoyl-AMP synthase [Betaproteobacteria bacterium]
MAQLFAIHPVNPQQRLIDRAADLVRGGAVIAYPTDSCYALGCHLGDKAAMERIREIRMFDESHHLTLMCADLSQIAQYALVNNVQYRLLKTATPGSYTFILRATREVPRRLQHPKRSTIGLRIPDHPVARELLNTLGEPILSATLILPDDPLPLNDPEEIRDRLEKRIDLVIDSGPCGIEPTTVIDLTGDAPELVRRGRGDPGLFGLDGAANE